MELSIIIIKFFATILITNSHYDSIYPIRSLATGGSIGNSLFFMVSGYCLFKSNLPPFLEWYKKRILRIYPSLWILMVVNLLLRSDELNIHTIIFKFIFPTNHWFISAIVIFYIAYYFIIKSNSPKFLLVIFILLFIPYFYMYLNYLDTTVWVIEGNGLFKWIFYFQIMLLGGIIKTNKNKLTFKTKKDSIILIMFLFLYFGFKYEIDTNRISMQLQFIIHITTYFITYYIYKFACSRFIQGIYTKKAFIENIIVQLSGLTLEIYIVQGSIINLFHELMFPINFIIVTLVIILLAYIGKFASGKLTNIAALVFNKSVKASSSG
jgi:hypothetical protein